MSHRVQPQKIALSWSGGKDAAYALYRLLNDERYDVVVLLTTFHHSANRSSMHGHVPEIIRAQMEQIGLPIYEIWIQETGANGYASAMENALQELKKQYQIEGVAFGDLFLEEVRNYRIKNMESTGLDCIFPIWKTPTEKVAHEIFTNGFQTKICCVTKPQVNEKWLGEDYTSAFVSSNEKIDPCGENGEFHTFVYNAPYFKTPLKIRNGDKKFVPVPEKFREEHHIDGHWYIDILLDS